MPDVAAFYTVEELKKISDGEVEKIHCFMFSNGGTPSGGTLATRAAMTAAMGSVAKIMGNPFALGGVVGDGKRLEDSDKILNKIEHYPEFDGWSGPFTYAFYDTRLIRRSNWLLADLGEDPYGRSLNYTEHILFPDEEVRPSWISTCIVSDCRFFVCLLVDTKRVFFLPAVSEGNRRL